MYLLQDADDAALVNRSLAGDATPFETLVTRHQRALYTVACRLLGNKEDAADALQGALIKAYEHLASFDPRHRFFSWIYRIDRDVRRTVSNIGAQADIHFSALSSLDLTLSFGGAVAFEDGYKARREFMVAESASVITITMARWHDGGLGQIRPGSMVRGPTKA